jgi:hypothetical protein
MTDPQIEGPDREPTRVTPYELAFGEAGMEAHLFAAIEAEVDAGRIEATRLDRFTLIPAAERALAEIVPEEAPPEATEQHRVVLFHAFNFWRFGRRFYLLEPEVARGLVDAPPSIGTETLPVPHPSFYIQFPANLFWGSIAPDTPPEPVDGFFVTTFDGTDPLGDPFRHVHALMILGIRRNRAGFSAIAFETESGPRISTEWLEQQAREDGSDFENVLPGGEMQGIYSILTIGEAQKLLGRALAELDARSDLFELEDPMERRSSERPGSVRYSRLPCFRVSAAARPGPGGDS